MTTLYPRGYGKQLVPLADLIREYHPKMHPEFSRRLFPWIESMGGLIGIGSGWRLTQPDKPGVAPEGKSFHQDQRFASGFVGYAAVDLVARDPGRVHRAPSWDESVTGPKFGVHTFIKLPQPEPWHMQPVEIRGWASWVAAGRLDPKRWDPPVPLPPPEEPVMKPILWRPMGYANVFIIQGFEAMHASEALIKAWGLNINDIVDDNNAQTLRSVLHFSGLTEADLVK